MIVFFFKKLSYYHYKGVLGERKMQSTHQVNQNRAIPIFHWLMPMLVRSGQRLSTEIGGIVKNGRTDKYLAVDTHQLC
jgi:hypothetical protein